MGQQNKATRVHSRSCQPAGGKFVPTKRLECVYSRRNIRRGINRRNIEYRNLSRFTCSSVLGIRWLLSLARAAIPPFV